MPVGLAANHSPFPATLDSVSSLASKAGVSTEKVA